MGLSISILFLSYFELFECVKNRLNLLSYRDFRTFRNIPNHAPEHTKMRYGTFQNERQLLQILSFIYPYYTNECHSQMRRN